MKTEWARIAVAVEGNLGDWTRWENNRISTTEREDGTEVQICNITMSHLPPPNSVYSAPARLPAYFIN
jgi:hypothetical protein